MKMIFYYSKSLVESDIIDANGVHAMPYCYCRLTFDFHFLNSFIMSTLVLRFELLPRFSSDFPSSLTIHKRLEHIAFKKPKKAIIRASCLLKCIQIYLK